MAVSASLGGGGVRLAEGSGRWVRRWLWCLAGLVVLMAIVGAATRLTGSGLSITEWKPVTGAVPPLSAEAWAAEFAKYRASSQYANLNRGMELGEFQFIYWWEWSHRQLGRFIGLLFFLPLALFWTRGLVSNRLATMLLAVGALGGLQAAVGWIMVASGLEPGMVAVAPVKLAIHLVLASAILAALVWLATGLDREARRAEAPSPPALVASARLFVGLVLIQIALGGLVAGSKAGWTYNTWPLMDGRLVPPLSDLLPAGSWFDAVAAHPILVQFNHRMVAYLLVAFALWQAWALARARPGSAAARRGLLLAGLALAQMVVGIVTLILVVPIEAGLAHQFLALLLLGAATWHARLAWAESRGREVSRSPGR